MERINSMIPKRKQARAANDLWKRFPTREGITASVGRTSGFVDLPKHVDLTAFAEGSIVYAVGDVHGMADLLDEIVAAIEMDAARHDKPATVIFLGDVVNRGLQTSTVLERLTSAPRRDGDRWLTLRGNHEQSFIEAFRGNSEFARFLKKGGAETLMSYGVRRKDLNLAALRASVPKTHREFLESLPHTFIIGNLLFVHAGVRPGRSLAHQTAETLLNIREPFLISPHGLPYTIVHGHVPSDGKPVVKPGRICVDTGAVITGILTAAAFDGSENVRFIRVVASAKSGA